MIVKDAKTVLVKHGYIKGSWESTYGVGETVLVKHKSWESGFYLDKEKSW